MGRKRQYIKRLFSISPDDNEWIKQQAARQGTRQENEALRRCIAIARNVVQKTHKSLLDINISRDTIDE